MDCGPAFAASPPKELWPELARWAQRACLRTVAREPVLCGLRESYGSATDVAKCFRKRLAARGADLSALPPDASSWIRIMSLAEFEAAALEEPGTPFSPEAGSPQQAVTSSEQERGDDGVEALLQKPGRTSAMVWLPSPLSPSFAEDGRRRLQELRAKAAAAVAC
jgi:hypothetical protein